ncbi:MAG: glycosyltransferase family A protein [Actinomycetota bacterium]|nr:glycosyltransferase family A protein [Actinomycetota bacterium]
MSFVVIAYNEARHVRATVDSILAQEDLEAFEVVVVDDGSTDATADVVEAIARDRPEVRLVRHDANRGRGAARASGVAAADGRWIAMVDADILLPARWWRTCREKLADHDAVGGTAVPDGDVAYVHRRYRLEPKVRGATTIVTGNNGAYLGEAIRTVTFDAALSEGEDVAINHALRSAGYRLTGIEGLVVEHQESKGFAASLRWLFVSGVGATRQLWRYRQVRPPDVAFAGFALVPVVTRRRPGLAIASVLAYALLAAAAHLAGRFRLDPRRPAALLAAVATDSLLLLAYFAGRAFGVVVLVRPRGAPAGRAGEP